MSILFISERLYFREFTLKDVDLIYELNSDPEVLKYLHEWPTTREVALQTLRYTILPQYRQNNFGRWAVFLKENDEFIGWCGLKYRKDLEMIDLGYRMKKQFWGKGFATEAAKRTIEFAKASGRIPKIVAFAHVDNIGSNKVLEKCGMTKIGETVIDNYPVFSYELVLY